jgi:thiol:disulfide interchange protein
LISALFTEPSEIGLFTGSSTIECLKKDVFMETVFAQSAVAFAAGMILNFMPCVLAVIPW